MKKTTEIVQDAEKNASFLCYDDFGALGDGVTDDYVAIYRTHIKANESGKTVVATPGKTYRLECPIVDGDGVWGNTPWKYDEVRAFLGRGYWKGLKPSNIGYDVKTEDGLYVNFSIINPPKFAKVLSNKGGYTYYVRNTAKSGLSGGGHHGVEENNKGFFGSTKFYYGEGEEDFYQGPPKEDEKCSDEQLYAFFD